MHQLITGSNTSIPAVCYACRLWCPLPCHKWVWLIFVNPGVKVKGQYYCDVLLSQQMLPAVKRVAKRCLFTKQYVAYGEIGHFLCSVISQGKVIALDMWGGKWNHLSITHRLTTNYAKNYCNRTLIVKVIVANVVTCFLGDTVYCRGCYNFGAVGACPLDLESVWPPGSRLSVRCRTGCVARSVCSDLDLGRLATGFGLLHLPKMPELKDRDLPNFEPVVMDYNTISFKWAASLMLHFVTVHFISFTF